MVKLIFLRHGERAYDNRGSGQRGRLESMLPRYDAPITPQSVAAIESTVGALLRDHGAPSGVVVSPFRRTRETADIATSLIQSSHAVAPPWLAFDARLSEYLGNQGAMTRETPAAALRHLDAVTRQLYTSPASAWPMSPRTMARFQAGAMIHETRDELRARVDDFLRSAAEARAAAAADGEHDDGGDYLLVVSHGFTISVARALIEGWADVPESIAPGAAWVAEY